AGAQRSPGPPGERARLRGYSLAGAGTVTAAALIADRLVAGSVHVSASLYRRPVLPKAVARRLALIGPVICQSADVAPSVPAIDVRLHETLQVSGALIERVTGTMAPFAGESDVLDETAVEFASANEYGVNDAGGFGTPLL